jgi:AAA-like domain
LCAFSKEETSDFARRHGIAPDAKFIEQVMTYLGGKPYLVHLLLYEMALHPGSEEEHFKAHSTGGGIFRDHLNHYLSHFQKETLIAKAMKRVIDGKGCDNVKIADRLEAAGLVRRDKKNQIVCSCGLYEKYFGGVL